jgi:hypothetical protein
MRLSSATKGWQADALKAGKLTGADAAEAC